MVWKWQLPAQELTTISFEEARMQTIKTTRKGLQALQDAPLILNPAEELLNSTRNNSVSNVNSPDIASKPLSHLGSGYNNRKVGSVSPKHNVFVIGVDGTPLTPTTNARARKLMRDKQAKPIWNKFSQFGIQMSVNTGKAVPKTALGVDFGTKFEGYAVAVGKENNLSVMWKLPDKKKIVKKLTERSQLRRTRRNRNCRRREARFDNREKKDFIAPSQNVMVQSRMKALQEFFKCYPIDVVAMEDVRFNHSKKRYGKNFSTVEIGKKRINDWVRQKATLLLYSGIETQMFREMFGYRKSGDKSAETFNSHCSDALALAGSVLTKERIPIGNFEVVDDTYRFVRRKLHDTKFAKGGIRSKYSTGNFKGIRKGSLCEFGQIAGGTKKLFWIRNWENKRIGRTYIDWLSKSFKIKGVLVISLPSNSLNLEVLELPTIR